MKTRLKIAIATAILFIAPVAFACDYPSTPKIPDGRTAPTEVMVTANNAVKAYQVALEEYRNCLDTEENQAIAALDNPGDDELAIRQAAIDKKYNASIDAEELLVARFNEAVVAYKARSK